MSAIGREIAASFVKAGAQVYGADRDVADVLEGIQTEKCDLVDAGEVSKWISRIEAETAQPIGILVNNAGGVVDQEPLPIENVTDSAWDNVIDANLTTTRNLCRAVVPGMKRIGRGVIVNIGSGASKQPSLTGVQAYCAAKHAVLGLTRQLAFELGPFGIRVNCIAPGFIITGPPTQRQWDKMGHDRQQQLIQSIPLRRLGAPQDIANAVLLIASDYASFISGQMLDVNGGR